MVVAKTVGVCQGMNQLPVLEQSLLLFPRQLNETYYYRFVSATNCVWVCDIRTWSFPVYTAAWLGTLQFLIWWRARFSLLSDISFSLTYFIDTEGGINGHCQRSIHCYISQSECNNDGPNGQIQSCLSGWLEQSICQEQTVAQSLNCLISTDLLPSLQVREEAGRQGEWSCHIYKYLHCSLQGLLWYGSVEANCLLEWSQIDIEGFSIKGLSSDVLNL